MKKIVFFSIPAHGHTNPTIELIRELVNRGNEVLYYSFNEYKEKIENAGAKFISCDDFLLKLPPRYEKELGENISTLFEMVLDLTIELDNKVYKELKEINPDCIVSDSMSIWGKLFANKLNIPHVCSTTTFAFNKHTIKMMKPSLNEIYNTVLRISSINKKIKILVKKGFDIDNFISLFLNDNDTSTIVYTSKEFQPMAETFSDKFYFIGPSIPTVNIETKDKKRKKVYISLGTVFNNNIKFFKNCIKAFENVDIDVVMSIGNNINIDDLGYIPSNFKVKNHVNQIEELQDADVFLTHCGMNSTHESLYYNVPMVLFPQQSEQKMISKRISTLGAGVILKRNHSSNIKNAVMDVINNNMYKLKASEISHTFKNSGGAKVAVDNILSVANRL